MLSKKLTLGSAIAGFGVKAKAKLGSPAAIGEQEEQLRAPFEHLLGDLAELCKLPRSSVVAIGESAVNELNTRPDYAVAVHKTLVGFIELKAPGKGADPRRFREKHDKVQWQKLQLLPNLLYSDGNAFSLWQDGELVGSVISLVGDIESSGDKLEAPIEILNLFEQFLFWEPIPPRNAKELAHISARLCRVLRDEVLEQLTLGAEEFTELAVDWRRLLFPDASDERFADGYAQAVTFGLLMARAQGIELASGLDTVSSELAPVSSLIGSALLILTENPESREALKTSLGTLVRVLDAVDWPTISKGNPEAWLYFYEDFLGVYDNQLRKQTGSYYTPPEVVAVMVGLVDDLLRSPRYGQHSGLASQRITLADPATGTGTFLLGALRRIADSIEATEGEGAVKPAINAAVDRLIAFEMQLGPFAVAQLRLFAEIADLTGAIPRKSPRMFVTDTLGNPFVEQEWLPAHYKAIGESRRSANKIKREEPINVVIGNPPYKERARGLGGWIEGESRESEKRAPLADWLPPREWGMGAHAKHLRNLYVYFWRWATWKVFDHHPDNSTGIVCFITVAGFLGGPGFQKMREYLRKKCDDIWVIDCSPEGHQPDTNTRIFEGVQQPVCIVLASRTAKNQEDLPGAVRFQSVPMGLREAKFSALRKIELEGEMWRVCPSAWREPFLPASEGAWATYPALDDFFIYNGSGVQPKRVWVIAPDAQSLLARWRRLIDAPAEAKQELFHPTLRRGKPADRHIRSVLKEALPGFDPTPTPLIDEAGPCETPVRYGYRSFNRQWIIPDMRVITQHNAELWRSRSERQVYITALTRTCPTSGPAITLTGLVPDQDHYKGSFAGRVFPLWRDAEATIPNIRPNLIEYLAKKFATTVTAEDVVAYIAAIAAHPGYAKTFKEDLSTPGLRVPITAAPSTFAKGTDLGRTVVWLHSFGERMADSSKGRPPEPPRLPKSRRPTIPRRGTIPEEPEAYPDSVAYDSKKKRLIVGAGYVENVEPNVWEYEVSGKQVIVQWFSYRKADRRRPLIGERRAPSSLGGVQPDHWLAEYTTELINLLNVLGWLVDLEDGQARLLEEVRSGPVITESELRVAGAFDLPAARKRKKPKPGQSDLFGEAGSDDL